ncbi:hypothetical protein [Francisella salimarina]|uniref:hypothetical protein n=1 Tax=Francisella salimarina TaxID=2599927 RepID=UPI003751120C
MKKSLGKAKNNISDESLDDIAGGVIDIGSTEIGLSIDNKSGAPKSGIKHEIGAVITNEKGSETPFNESALFINEKRYNQNK